jgi:uncharacterized membrane protein
VETVVGATLRAGVVLSVALIAAGLAWHWVVNGDWRLSYSLPATTVGGFLRADAQQLAARETRPRLLVNLGIAVLMLTPYVRVLASFVAFALERNWKYAAFTGCVLVTLTYSLFV